MHGALSAISRKSHSVAGGKDGVSFNNGCRGLGAGESIPDRVANRRLQLRIKAGRLIDVELPIDIQVIGRRRTIVSAEVGLPLRIVTPAQRGVIRVAIPPEKYVVEWGAISDAGHDMLRAAAHPYAGA